MVSSWCPLKIGYRPEEVIDDTGTQRAKEREVEVTVNHLGLTRRVTCLEPNRHWHYILKFEALSGANISSFAESLRGKDLQPQAAEKRQIIMML